MAELYKGKDDAFLTSVFTVSYIKQSANFWMNNQSIFKDQHPNFLRQSYVTQARFQLITYPQMTLAFDSLVSTSPMPGLYPLTTTLGACIARNSNQSSVHALQAFDILTHTLSSKSVSDKTQQSVIT